MLLSIAEAAGLGVREGETVEIAPKRAVPPEPQLGTRLRYVDGLPDATLEEMVAEMRRLGADFEPPTVDGGPDRGSEIIEVDDLR